MSQTKLVTQHAQKVCPLSIICVAPITHEEKISRESLYLLQTNYRTHVKTHFVFLDFDPFLYLPSCRSRYIFNISTADECLRSDLWCSILENLHLCNYLKQFGVIWLIILVFLSWLIIGVADGVGGWTRYGIDAGEFSSFLMRTCERLVQTNNFNPHHPINLLSSSYHELLDHKKPILGEYVLNALWMRKLWINGIWVVLAS